MLFNSYEFIFLFVPICLIGFYILQRHRHDGWVYWLSACSLFFYGYWDFRYLPIIVASILINYAIAKYMTDKKSKPALIGGLAFNLTLLFYFKYFNFFIDTTNMMGTDWQWYHIVLPIGISFFTFQQIAFLVDTYRDRKIAFTFPRYVFFVSFFPQLIAGPIVHHAEISGQIDKRRKHLQNFAIGFSIFAIGLFKKVVIADTMAITATGVFGYAEAGGEPTLMEAWYGALAYSLQIYFDFSAYSDMAIGLGKMFGLRLPQNFASPYKATSIADFWRRWHITLSRFLKDYLYIPLGGNRRGSQKVNLMVTMLLGGLWHGASFNFLFWGGLHGIYLVINHGYTKLSKSVKFLVLPKFIAWGITMLAVVFAWVPFRAVNLEGTMNVWKGMVGMHGIQVPPSLKMLGLKTGEMLKDVTPENGALIAALIGICVVMPNTAQIMRRYLAALTTPGYPATFEGSKKLYWRPTLLWGVVITGAFWLAVLKLSDPTEFLYFQF